MVIMTIAVLVHYEALYRLTRWLPKAHVKHRFRIVMVVGGALLAHIAEVWVFAFAYYVLVVIFDIGSFGGSFENTLMDCFYFSFTTFTTLGFGDIQPFAEIRYLTGVESLTGLVLITWTASFIYLEMQKFWSTN
jgi:hypothetical protein